MLSQIENLHLIKKDKYFELIATIETNQGLMTVKSKVAQPDFHINCTSNPNNGFGYKQYILNKQASFHFNADALVDPKTQTLFTLTMDKKGKTHIPKKHKKHNRNSTRKK